MMTLIEYYIEECVI